MLNSTASLTAISAAMKLKRRQWDPPKKLKVPIEYEQPDPIPPLESSTSNAESHTGPSHSGHEAATGDTHSGHEEFSNANTDTGIGESLAEAERFAAAVLMEMVRARAASAPPESVPNRYVLLLEVAS